MKSVTSERLLTACWPSWQSTLSNVGLPSCGCDLLLKSGHTFFLNTQQKQTNRGGCKGKGKGCTNKGIRTNAYPVLLFFKPSTTLPHLLFL